MCKGLQATFISASRLDKSAGIYVITGGNQVRVVHNGRLVMDGPLLENGLYKLNCTVETPIAYLAKIRLLSNEEKFMFYHETFCHLNAADLQRMKDKLKITVPPNFQCYICAKAKIKELPFGRSSIKSTRPLQLVHTDTSGPIRIPNRNQYKVFTLNIDDYSRYIWVALLKQKSEVFDAFLKFKATAERATGQQLVVVRSDNGTEFVNSKFKALVDKEGLQRQFTVIKTPQQDGVSERGMGVIKEKSRSALLGGNVAVNHWPYAVLYAVHTRNVVPCSSIKNEIPYERFYGKPYDNYQNMYPFGTRCVYRDETDNPFEPPGHDGAFFGLPTEVKGFYIYSYEKRKVVIRRSVDFLRESPYNDIRVPPEEGEEDDFDLESEELCGEATEQIPYQLRQVNLMLPEMVDILQNKPTATAKSAPTEKKIEKKSERPNNNPDPPAAHQNKGDQSSTANGGNSEQTSSSPPELPDLDFAVDEITEQQPNLNLLDDLQHQSEPPPTDRRVGDYGQNEKGQITMNQTQRAKFEAEHPEVNLKALRGVPHKGAGKWVIYQINNITAPKSLNQAMNSPNARDWRESMISERDRLLSTGTLGELVPRPAGVAVLPLMWIYTIKLALNGMIDRFKSRLVVLGNRQKIGRDFAETFAPVINELTFRVFLSYVVQFGLLLHHVDVQTAYLNADVQGDVYVQQPPGFVVPGKEGYVYKLGRALYGLRQSAYQWFCKLNQVMNSIGLKRCLSDQCLFTGKYNGEIVLLAVYVDDCLIAAKSIQTIEHIKRELRKHFDLTDKGQVRHFLNLDIDYEPATHRLYVSQSHYIKQLLDLTGMKDCKGVRTPVVPGTDLFASTGAPFTDVAWYQSAMGRLIYLATHSRPDIAFGVARLCAFMHNPTEDHVVVLKRIIRYLKETVDYRLIFSRSEPKTVIYCDADYANNLVTSHSVTGVATFVFGNLVDWFSRKQRRVANSTCQAEINAIQDAVIEAEFVHHLLMELGLDPEQIRLLNDNQSARLTLLELGDFAKNKHYRTVINMIREIVQLGWIKIEHCPSERMIADFLTKPMVEAKLRQLVNASGIRSK